MSFSFQGAPNNGGWPTRVVLISSSAALGRLTSDALPFGRLWYGEPNAISNAIGSAIPRSRSHDAVIRVYDEAGNVIETHEQADGRAGEPTEG